MNDYLTQLANRLLKTRPPVEPRLLSRFEPQPLPVESTPQLDETAKLEESLKGPKLDREPVPPPALQPYPDERERPMPSSRTVELSSEALAPFIPELMYNQFQLQGKSTPPRFVDSLAKEEVAANGPAFVVEEAPPTSVGHSAYEVGTSSSSVSPKQAELPVTVLPPPEVKKTHDQVNSTQVDLPTSPVSEMGGSAKLMEAWRLPVPSVFQPGNRPTAEGVANVNLTIQHTGHVAENLDEVVSLLPSIQSALDTKQGELIKPVFATTVPPSRGQSSVTFEQPAVMLPHTTPPQVSNLMEEVTRLSSRREGYEAHNTLSSVSPGQSKLPVSAISAPGEGAGRPITAKTQAAVQSIIRPAAEVSALVADYKAGATHRPVFAGASGLPLVPAEVRLRRPEGVVEPPSLVPKPPVMPQLPASTAPTRYERDVPGSLQPETPTVQAALKSILPGQSDYSASPAQVAPTIQVKIGRIEVRATPETEDLARRVRPRPTLPNLSLDEYLRRRDGGK